jgi:hypothetical protein
LCIGLAARMTIREEETTTTTTNVDNNNFCLNNVSLDIKKKLKIYYITVNKKRGALVKQIILS